MLEKEEENHNKVDYSEISKLKEEIKSKEFTKKIMNKDKEEKSLKLYGNDINDKKPKYFGKTKSLLFIREIPVLILGEDSNFY